MEFRLCAIGGAGPQFLQSVDGLVRGGGKDQELMPLVCEETRVNLHGELLVEGKALGPLHELNGYGVPELAELGG